MVDQQTVRVFNDSFKRCQRGGQFFERFYEKFLESSEEVRDKFSNTDMARQARMMEQSLFTTKLAYNDNVFLQKKLEELAVIHAKKNLDIHPDLYAYWLNSVVDTAREMDPEFNDEIEAAWLKLLYPGVSYMIGQYEK